MKKEIFYTFLMTALVAGGLLLLQSRITPVETANKTGDIASCSFSSGASSTQVAVDSTSKNTVLAVNPGRIFGHIVNAGAVPVFLNLTAATSTAGRGIYLAANGGTFKFGCGSDPNYQGAITAITPTGTSTLAVTEK